MIKEPIFDVFARYLTSKRTSQRHKDLASLAIRACDALNLLFSIEGSCPGVLSEYAALCSFFRRLRSSGEDDSFDPSILDSAIMMGLSMSIGFSMDGLTSTLRGYNWGDVAAKNFDNWKASRISHIATQSPWRCTRHHTAGRWRQRLRAKSSLPLKTPNLDPHTIKKACGQHLSQGRDCDGSKMVFDMPDVGFRLILQLSEIGGDNVFVGKMSMLFLHPQTGQNKYKFLSLSLLHPRSCLRRAQ
ncbi:hypothetical protein HDK77DRAFT_121363 [Phyllosticta capitalensis]